MSDRNDDYVYFMNLALQEASKAFDLGEVPVGAVVVHNNRVIGLGHNSRESQNNALAHAEMIAINQACEHLKSWRLVECELYVTLEPCLMCAGAIINSRIERVIYGANDIKFGGCGSVINLFDLPVNHKPEVVGGILKDQSVKLLQDFFRFLRQQKNEQN